MDQIWHTFTNWQQAQYNFNRQVNSFFFIFYEGGAAGATKPLALCYHLTFFFIFIGSLSLADIGDSC